jgi:ankyrin repeat protein
VEAASLGSAEALYDLKVLDNVAYEDSLNLWRRRFCQIATETGHEVPNEEEVQHNIGGLSNIELDTIELNERGHRYIHLAASLNYFKSVETLLHSGADINKLNQYGENALLCACRAGNATLALDLLHHGAKIHLTCSGESPLHWLIACDDSQLKILAEGLVSKGADLEAQHTMTEQNEYNFDIYPHGTPLDWAVSRRKMAAINVLVDMGANPFNECSQSSPLVRAVSLHDFEVVESLLRSRHATTERKKGFDSIGQSLLFHAIYCNGPYNRLLRHGKLTMDAARATIRTLLEHGCDPAGIDKDGTSIVHLAASFASNEMIEILLNDFGLGKLINTSCGNLSTTPLQHAIVSGRLDAVQLFLSHGADPYCISWLPFHSEGQPNITSHSQTLLHMLAAVEDEHHAVGCLKLLNVSQRSDLNTRVDYLDVFGGLTAFETALFYGNILVADYLLSQGAEVQRPPGLDSHFLGALISQQSWYSLQALEYYMEKAKPSSVVQSKNQLTALHVAAAVENILADTTTAECKLEILLKAFKGTGQLNARTIAAPDLKAAGGQTPLHYAAKSGAYFAVQRLLESGADVNIRDGDGHSALDLARRYANYVHELIDELWMEVPRAARELYDTVSLLERAENGQPLPSIVRRVSLGESTRARFSRLGFKVAES